MLKLVTIFLLITKGGSPFTTQFHQIVLYDGKLYVFPDRPLITNYQPCHSNHVNSFTVYFIQLCVMVVITV